MLAEAKVSAGMCLVSMYMHDMEQQVGFHNTLLTRCPCFCCPHPAAPEPAPAPARRRGKKKMTSERKVQTSLIRGVSVKYTVMSMIYIVMSMLLIMSYLYVVCTGGDGDEDPPNLIHLGPDPRPSRSGPNPGTIVPGPGQVR